MTPPATSTWRFRAGATIFVVGFLSPALVPLVALLPLATHWKTAIGGLLMVGIPEVFTIAAVAVMGQEGFDRLKNLWVMLLRRYGPPHEVGVNRYRVGLAMFSLPILFAFVTPYAAHLIPGYVRWPYAFGLAGDALLIASLFVLGGNFWDKLRGLFVHQAKVVFPQTEPIGGRTA